MEQRHPFCQSPVRIVVANSESGWRKSVDLAKFSIESGSGAETQETHKIPVNFVGGSKLSGWQVGELQFPDPGVSTDLCYGVPEAGPEWMLQEQGQDLFEDLPNP